MAWTKTRIRIAGEALREGLARLVDVAPTKIIVLSEDTDWGLVGGDLRDAIEAEAEDDSATTSDDHKELVEA